MNKLIITFLGVITLSISTVLAQREAESKTHYLKMYGLAVKYNDFDVARNALYNILIQEPGNDSLRFALSYLYLQESKYASAVISAQDLLNRKPTHTGALEVSAVGYEKLGIKDKALTSYEGLYLQTDDFQTLYKMAFLQYELKRYNECKTNIDILMSKSEADKLTVTFNNEQKQAKEYPIKAALLNLQGLVHVAQEDKVAAKKSYEAALAIAPDLPFVKDNLTALNK